MAQAQNSLGFCSNLPGLHPSTELWLHDVCGLQFKGLRVDHFTLVDQLSDKALVHKTPFTKVVCRFCYQTDAESRRRSKEENQKEKHRRLLQVC